MSKIEGGCLCGSIRYTSETDPLMVVNCYCEDCRKNTGSTHSFNLVMPAGAVTVTGKDGRHLYRPQWRQQPALQPAFLRKLRDAFPVRGGGSRRDQDGRQGQHAGRSFGLSARRPYLVRTEAVLDRASRSQAAIPAHNP